MNLDQDQKTRLDDLRFMLGESAGTLAFALDQITDAMGLISQHTVYCRVEKGLRAGEPPLDVVGILRTLGTAKELVQGSVTRLREDRNHSGEPGA